MTPSRADLTNLVNADNEPPIVSRSAHNDEEEEEADVTMAEGAIGVDPDEAMDEDIIVEEAGEGDGAEDLGSEDDEDYDEEEDDDDSGDDSDDSDSSDIIAIDGPDGEPSASAAAPNVKTEPGADESTEPKKDAEGEGEVVNELKPKKKKRARPRSPSEDEDLPPPPPMPTIRLEIALPTDDETLDWNFIETAASAGFEGVFNAWGEDPLAGEGTPLNPVDLNGAAADGDSSTPAAPSAAEPPRPPGFSDEEWREMQEEARRLEAKYEEPKKKRVMAKKRKIEYDLSDPFIDDSDLGIDAPTHVARPKKEGFFVHQGALELMEGSPIKKPKAKTSRANPKAPKEQRKSLSEAVRERHAPNGSRASPILIGSDDEAGPSYIPDRRSPSPVDAPEDRYAVDRTLFKAASREPKYLPPFDEFPDDVGHRLRSLRRESSKHVWDLNNKGKFPEHLKRPLQRAGVAAFHHDLLCIPDKETTDSGYERFSEKAFVTALCSVLPYNRLTLGKLVLKLCYTEYWKWMQMCEAEGLRQWNELLKPEIPAMLEQYEQAVLEHARQEVSEITELEDDQNKAKSTDPKKLPTITQEMKDIFRQLVENTQEMVDINKKMEDWGQKFEGQSSELNMRKLLYNKIAKLYPEGWMTSLTLSRQYTNYKRLGQGSKNSGASGGDGQAQQAQLTQQ
ncbi:hypothetical protein Q8F55_000307 [Vanrija albida]|uniref:Ubinuclein middle domain-containing protein n=1 Tax=Vanrija albida TaxID=181172 RepID=A0ABR3QCW8_9TREE